MSEGFIVVGSVEESDCFSCFDGEEDKVLTGCCDDHFSLMTEEVLCESTAKLALREAAKPMARSKQ